MNKFLKLNNNIGKLGEEISTKYLIASKFTIIHRNWLEKTGEIDIVALKQGILHFIEVKSVSCENISILNTLQFRPEDNVHHKKLVRLYKTIELYILKNNISVDHAWQIDIIAVYIDKITKQAKVVPTWNIIE